MTIAKSLTISLRIFALVFIFVNQAFADTVNQKDDFRLVVQSESWPSAPLPTLHADNLRNIKTDWNTTHLQNEGPDRSYKSVWVRMFPIRSVPAASEPYPITQNINWVRLYNSRKLTVKRFSDHSVLGEGKEVVFQFDQKTIKIDGRTLDLEKVWIQPKNSQITTTTRWDRGLASEVGVELRGEFVVQEAQLWRTPEKLWSLINVVSVEHYLYAVLPSEMPLSFHDQALKVQSVAARTYALFEMAVARGDVEDLGRPTPITRDWDVDPTIWYQSYRGKKWLDRSRKWRDVELQKAINIVRSTTGEILTHNGKIIKAFFSANSGGITCKATECFNWEEGYENPAYLQPVKDADGIKNNRTGTWGTRQVITPNSIRGKLTELEFDSAFEPTELLQPELSDTGRTWNLFVQTKDHGQLRLDRKQTNVMIRLFGRIRSHLFTLTRMRSGKQKVKGHGFGHAVGMSQVGANLFAKQGKSHKDILTHFYTGVKVEQISGL